MAASSGKAAWRLHLVYIGADAELAPAASLLALAGIGASCCSSEAVKRPAGAHSEGCVMVPAGLSPELVELVADAAKCGLREISPLDAEAVFSAQSSVLVAIAGLAGPALARELLWQADARGCTVVTTPARPLFDDCLVGQELLSLQGIARVLRAQCPWDRVQTAQDIVSYSVEEVYELADAIAEDNLQEQHSELGDVLFQVYFLSLLLEERGSGDLGTVARAIENKLIRRHEHIFSDGVAETPAQVRGLWERIKREKEGRQGVFHDVPATLPALLYARKLQRRAAEVGFDWDTALQAFSKIAEEYGELAEAMSAHGPVGEFDGQVAGALESDEDVQCAPLEAAASPTVEMRHDPHLWHEFGDLLFATVNVARKAGVDPELALRQASRRFERRVSSAEALALAEGNDWSALGLTEQEKYYQRAKREEG